jgi:hypothetical protein
MGLYFKHQAKESLLEKKLKELVTAHGGISRKFSSPSHRGVPDRIVFWPRGNIHFVELKTETGKLTELQKHEHKTLKTKGAKVYTLYGLKQIEDYAERFGYSYE